MNPRVRYLETLLFGKPDRIPLEPGAGRESTLRVWHEQGLPEDVHDITGYAYREVGGQKEWPRVQHVVPDEVEFSEDMAYKKFSMLSPKTVREFLLPTYKRWGEIIRDAGCPVYAMDSDGFLGELIPIWMEAGVNVCWPMEVAAENDIVEFRRRFGRGMAYR